MATAGNPREREDPAWREFLRNRDPKSIPDIDPLFALPNELILAIKKHDGEFWSEADVSFEDDLEQSSAGVFINKKTAPRLVSRQFLLQSDFEDSHLLTKEGLPEENREQSKEADRKKFLAELESAKLTNLEIDQILTDIEGLDKKLQRSRIAYAGWLVVHETFIDELACLRKLAPPTVGQNGRFPVLKFGYSQRGYESMGKIFAGVWTPSNEREQEFDEKCQVFFHRWCLKSLFNWDIPIPLDVLPRLNLESLPAWVSIEPQWRRFDEERTQAVYRAGQGGGTQEAPGGQGAGVGPVR